MNSTDLITILGNISQSLYPVQKLITGGAYILGILFFLTAISKLRKIADYRAQSSSHEKMFTPMMYLLIGALLIYLPTGLDVMANTAFGVGNVLTYSNYNPANIYSSMGFLIRTAGVLWFIRGCVLVAHASQPGTQQGLKGLLFLIAGVFAMNFDNTIAMINAALEYFMKMTLAIKSAGGF
ncbi:type IV secretion protein IcmC [Legionella norrlandica]|uniref:Type IV secretion protein IcmC n=1 Tax=Legionella norrlandica TaxID=1498499 RepID=A0A0A2T5A9_9GAMM|nr:hypothetical protein [Legionella norrlandica]KGP62623.1 type IV secretion protein IcmC [Legionella norrlandica]